MKLIVGLGNPGEKYIHSRHNAGFIVLYTLHPDGWKEKPAWKAWINEVEIEHEKYVLLMPHTFMNLSGESVQLVKNFYKLENSDITVIHDELDLPFGEIRQKGGGGSAGHNGIESVTSHIGSDYNRIRIGIRNELADIVDASDFVLANFTEKEYKLLKSDIARQIEEIL